MPLLNPYCLVSDVQAETQNTEAEDVQVFVNAINDASRWIDWYCRRDFLFHDHAVTPLVVQQNWCAENVIYLPWPVLTLTAVSVDDGGDVSLLVAASDYRVEPSYYSSTARLYRAGRWLRNDAYTSTGLTPMRLHPLQRQISLTGTFGYVQANTYTPSVNVPAEVKRACTVLAAIRSGKARREVVDFGGNRQSITQKSIPKEISDMVDRYRVPLV